VEGRIGIKTGPRLKEGINEVFLCPLARRFVSLWRAVGGSDEWVITASPFGRSRIPIRIIG